MQVLVTGGSGFIGSGLIADLISKGFHVRALLRKSSSIENLKGLKFETRYGDLGDITSLKEAASGVDYVFHLAGAVWARHRKEYFYHNALGTENLALAVAESAPQLKRFIYVSSIAAAGPSKSKIGISENECTPHPVSDYGASKLGGEIALEKTLKKIPYSIVRPPVVYGPRDKSVFEFIKVINKGIIPRLKGHNAEGEKYYNFIYVEDLIDCIVRAGLTEKQDKAATYFSVHPDVVSWSEVMGTVATALGKQRTIKVSVPYALAKTLATISTAAAKTCGIRFELDLDKLRQMVPDYYVYSGEKAKQVLDFQAKTNLTLGMTRAVQWYRAQGMI